MLLNSFSYFQISVYNGHALVFIQLSIIILLHIIWSNISVEYMGIEGVRQIYYFLADAIHIWKCNCIFMLYSGSGKGQPIEVGFGYLPACTHHINKRREAALVFGCVFCYLYFCGEGRSTVLTRLFCGLSYFASEYKRVLNYVQFLIY